MPTTNLNATLAVALLALPGFFATVMPSIAATNEVPAAASAFIEAQGEVKRRTFSVTVTNTTNGEVGCHNETTQSSEPGRCAQPPH